ncbi:hypothetical protein HRD49_40865 [Corallococcus exiguus]|uniref:hypothetical protein n=1 Tax=Corallococcus TaxID=83461 RepID=UPI000F874091|nr:MULTISPECIES: hypothetical protein [Corallococcus]NNC22203.1 hypothetical protein [Corallococcus exiguus]NRD59225.1 hypothetical protein [Corallococcus exiguus]NRD68100.1 hypothetical protein [Corallococcus exiguus]
MQRERGANEEAIQVLYRGVTNGFLPQVCEAILLYNAVVGTGYDICNHCRWEDAGTVSDSVDSSINKGTMSQYREQIREESNYYCREKWSQ